jgi:hypothetical protein
MSLNERVLALRERHAGLETKIEEETRRPRPNLETLSQFKIEKLRIKDEIERLIRKPPPRIVLDREAYVATGQYK